jgi:hypothetical protein
MVYLLDKISKAVNFSNFIGQYAMNLYREQKTNSTICAMYDLFPNVTLVPDQHLQSRGLVDGIGSLTNYLFGIATHLTT